MQINPARLLKRLEELATVGARLDGGVCRLSLTDEDKRARDLLRRWMIELNLTVTIDKAGNMYGLRKGTENLPAVAIGSHLDTVVTGGKYDGSYGVLAGLEVVHTLNENKIETKRPLVVINFTNEEGARFAPDMMGSLLLSRPELLHDIWDAKALDNSNCTVKSELERIGYLGNEPPGHIPISHYLELHIEQGPVLESEQLQIGIVEKVQGIYWTEYILHGVAAHAGTTPIANRRDAGLAAARINLYLRELTNKIPQQLCTLGLMEFHPNAVNVVPDRVRLITDLRNPDAGQMILAQSKLDEFVKEVAALENISFDRTEKVRFGPVLFSTDLTNCIEDAAKELGYAYKRMVSGAGHDAQMMAAICEAAMIFVPSANGISHNVNEYTSPKDLERGANVLLKVALKLLA